MSRPEMQVVKFAVLCLFACLPVAAEVEGEIHEYGITSDLTPIERVPNREVPGGIELKSDMEVTQQTDLIEAKPGVTFGYHFSVYGLNPGDRITLKKVVTYPEMRLPDGSVSRGYTKTLGPTTVRSDGSVETVQGYALEHEFELVLGEWNIEIWYQEKKVVGKVFRLILPAAN